jgi:hypothetical protein
MTRAVLRAISAAFLLFAAGSAGGGEGSTFTFGDHSFELVLPAGYEFAGDASPLTGFKTFGFATAPRPDGTRGTLQVTLLDFAEANMPEPSLEELAREMAGGIQRSRADWESSTRSVTLAGVAARRVEWSGQSVPGTGGATGAFPMRGVIYVGIKDGLGFAVSTQDVSPMADETVPACERALESFAVEVG